MMSGSSRTTHISSPKPESQQISPAKEETRKSFIKECPPEAFKLNMESHIATVYAEHEARQKRRNELNDAIAALGSQNGQRALFHVEQFVNKMESYYFRMMRAKNTINQQSLDLPSGLECSICLKPRDRTFALLPCGHATFCESCAAHFCESPDKRCPSCREVTTGKLRLFQ